MYVPAHKTKIMIHCLATPPSWGQGKTAEQMVAEVRLWHTDPKPQGRGWSDIAYAEIGDYEGRGAPGRDLNNDGNTFDDTGAGAFGHNTDTIHLALAGGRWPDGRWGARTDKFSDHFTPAQDRWLRETIAKINRAAGRELQVLGHNEVDPNKGCPAFDVPTWLKDAPAAPVTKPVETRNPLAAILNAIFKALGLGKGGPA
jgi:N-acetylmuramoyl-L-alanine amidase